MVHHYLGRAADIDVVEVNPAIRSHDHPLGLGRFPLASPKKLTDLIAMSRTQ